MAAFDNAAARRQRLTQAIARGEVRVTPAAPPPEPAAPASGDGEARMPSVRRVRVQQRYRVLQLAVERGSVGFSRLDAARLVGCYELASRLGELEAEGVRFSRETIKGATNRYGDPVRVMVYRLTVLPKAHADALLGLDAAA